MRNFLTTGLFSAILGIVIGGAPADAALVSRGFLDEALENYATTTSLDLKANQSDFTDLNTQINDSVDMLRLLLEPGSPSYGFMTYINPEKYPNTISGAFGLLYQYLNEFARFILQGWTDSNGTYYAGFDDLNNGWTDSEKKTYLGVKGLNDKIGTLPDGLTVQAMYDGWTDSKGVIHNGLNDLSTITNNIDLSVEGPIAALMGYENGYKTRVKAVLNQLFMTIPDHPNLYNLAWRILEGSAFSKFAQEMYGIPGYKGLVDLTKGVGDLPSGNFPEFPESEKSFSILKQPLTYPTSLAELITALYGISGTGAEGLLAAIIASFPLDTDGDGSPDAYTGLIPNFYIATDANDLANANATKIGTIPDGKNLAGMISETDAKIGDLPTEYATVGAALTAIKGIAEDAKAAALSAIPDPKVEGSTGKFVLTVDIVGDNATYRWEKIDREGETTTTE